jgi:group I intron endonuclease
MFVYLVKNIVNGKRYVGQHIGDDLGRYWSHCVRRAKAGSVAKPALYAAMRKYGVDHFRITPLVVVNSKSDLDRWEKELIKILNTKDRAVGYNCTDGGEGLFGYRHSEETKSKIRLALMGNRNGAGHTVSEEYRARLKGNKHAFGYRHTDEAKKRISLSLVGNSRAKSDDRRPRAKN